MTDRELLRRYRVITPCSTVVSNFYGDEFSAPATVTFRTYMNPGAYGPQAYRFWVSNVRETTRGETCARLANTPGGFWRIDGAFLADGGTRRDGALYGEPVPVPFGGSLVKDVTPDEEFLSDEVTLDLPEGHDLAFSWTVTRLQEAPSIPCTQESILAAYGKSGGGAVDRSADGFAIDFNGRCALPSLFLRRAPSGRVIAFLGDSITQGYGTGEGREMFWAAQVMKRLPAGYNALNLGSGWARAYDAASDGAWLRRAKAADEVVICLGINDIGACGRSSEEITKDLTEIVQMLKAANPEMRVFLFTLPPIDFGGDQLSVWRSVNDWIRGGNAPGAEVFDTVPVLGRSAPNEHLVREEYRFALNAHPNARAGEVLARAFLAWRG
jgi:lysophospholipase L1-like esterase